MALDAERRGLIENDRVEEYDGTTAILRNRHLRAEDIEFLRWRAERWMKVRHMKAAWRHDPWFVLTHGHAMLAHTFRGTTWRTWCGLEPSRAAFGRYRQLRAREREYLPASTEHVAQRTLGREVAAHAVDADAWWGGRGADVEAGHGR